MKEKNTSNNGGKDEETYKGSALLEGETIDREISVKGAESLTNTELLAVIMSGDMGALNPLNLLKTFDGNLVHLFCACVRRLMEMETPHMMFLPQEEFRVTLLNAKQKLIWIETVSLGSLDSASVEPRHVSFKERGLL